MRRGCPDRHRDRGDPAVPVRHPPRFGRRERTVLLSRVERDGGALFNGGVTRSSRTRGHSRLRRNRVVGPG